MPFRRRDAGRSRMPAQVPLSHGYGQCRHGDGATRASCFGVTPVSNGGDDGESCSAFDTFLDALPISDFHKLKSSEQLFVDEKAKAGCAPAWPASGSSPARHCSASFT
jgi:hypothetical protein